MPRLSLGLGVGGSGLIAPAAPSGIPVASAASVVIGNAGTGNNGTYVRKVPQQQLLLSDAGVSLFSNIAGTCYVLGAGNADGRILFSPDAQAWSPGLGPGSYQTVGTPFGSWVLAVCFFDAESSGDWGYSPIATNASTDANYIPTSGWSPAITITAAPSGIPVAGTSAVIVSNNTDPSRNWSGTYTYNSGNGHYDLDLGSVLQSIYWVSNANQWVIYYTNFDNSEEIFNETASQNQNYIPTAGWLFTITAA